LASGRDADIFEYGPGLVLRRTRDRRSLAGEARIMAYLHDQGFPVPAVDELSDDGSDLVMERIDAPSMVEAVGRAPWTVRHQGRVLADLHHRLHEIPAPEFLAPAPVGEGDRVVHLDLHPLNVLVGRGGPVVIDWTGASRGDPDADVALAWLLMSAGAVPGGGLKAALLGWARGLLVNAFTGQFDRDRVARTLPAVLEWKVRDPHMSEQEIAGMRRLVERAGTGPR
jgi:aminoglycoside phosphotransferase (APT) family kinase protein